MNQAEYEEPLFACVAGDDVLGIAVGGPYSPWDNGYAEFRFSIAVNKEGRRKGVGRALVRAIIAHFKTQRSTLLKEYGGVELVAWVINPNMAALLESEGFDTDGSEWSQDAPMMRWDG